ncbi:hypothetical protein LEP1GSC047_2591 [Leptospira inadai serovar Lyme str. 10]|uniref:Uncharacterized protein n=1 Tax=Leptospira inadai serovar Lyme str. 10 TaxID=1049790 RepID=V6HCK8_9LEPT|nr:hypothetical protein LEP1GSC047_2591 [Leptospira inadai serovar Lyme str. 10]
MNFIRIQIRNFENRIALHNKLRATCNLRESSLIFYFYVKLS